MSGFTNIVIDKLLSEQELNELIGKFLLVITDVKKTPPHCSILYKDKWMSLNFSECKYDVPADVFFKLILNKNKPAIFLELNRLPDITLLQNIFSKYHKIDLSRQITCISPIKEMLNGLNIDIPKDALLFEMINILFEKKQVKKIYAMNFKSNLYSLTHYSIEILKTMCV